MPGAPVGDYNINNLEYADGTEPIAESDLQALSTE
jgi:hypothetical protein